MHESQAPKTFKDLMPIMQLNDKKEQEKIALKLKDKKRRHEIKKRTQSVADPAKNELRKYFVKIGSKPGEIDSVNFDSPSPPVKVDELANLNVIPKPSYQDSACKLGELGSQDVSKGGGP